VAEGGLVTIHFVYKEKAKLTLEAQELRGSATSSKLLSMHPQSDHPAPPAAVIHILEFTKLCYPACAEKIDKYMEFALLFCVLVSTRGFVTIDLFMRRAFFESGIPFFPFSTPTLLHLLSAFMLHRRPTDDTICKNCGVHRTQECDLFALAFTSDPTTPAASRRGRERDHSTSRS
jgi:hypothetical protein